MNEVSTYRVGQKVRLASSITDEEADLSIPVGAVGIINNYTDPRTMPCVDFGDEYGITVVTPEEIEPVDQ